MQTWHPLAAVLVYQSWLCLLIVTGLALVDYGNFLVHSHFKPLMRDLCVVTMVLVATRCILVFVAPNFPWPMQTVGVILILATLHAGSSSRRKLRLSRREHFTLLVITCFLSALLVCWICSWSGVTAQLKMSCFDLVTKLHESFVSALAVWIVCEVRLKREARNAVRRAWVAVMRPLFKDQHK